MINSKFNRFLVLLVGLLTMCVTQVWGTDMTIDFESATSTYSDWTFNNVTSAQTTITAHGGSKHGQIASASGYIVTKNAISNPSSITFYVSKSTNNTTSSDWKVQVSSNNTSWTDVKTQSATSMSKGTWVEVTQSLSTYSNVYVRVYYSGSNAVRCIDDLTLSTGSACTEPATALSITSAATATVGTPLSLTSAGGNGGSVTWSVTNGTGSATVEGSTLTPVTAGTVTVKAHQDQNGATCEQDAEKGVTISKQIASFTFSDGYVESTTYYVGDQYTLPSTTSTECGDKTFVGWSTAPIIEASPSKPASNYYDKGSKVTLTSSNTFYAVFADAGAGGVASLTKLGSGDTFSDGDKIVIVANTDNGKLMYQETVSTSYVAYKQVGSDIGQVELTAAGIAADDKNWFTLTAGTGANAGKWRLGDATNGYINVSSNNLYCNETATYFSITWNSTNKGFTIKDGSRWIGCRADLTGDNQYKWRGAGTSGSPTTGSVCYLDIYRYSAGGASYSNYTTTCGPATFTASVVTPAPSNGSINLSASTHTLTTLEGRETITINLTPADGYEVGTVTVRKAGGGTVETSGTGNTRTFTMPTENVTVSATFTLIPLKRIYLNTFAGWNEASAITAVYDGTNERWLEGAMTAGTGCYAGYLYKDIPNSCNKVTFGRFNPNGSSWGTAAGWDSKTNMWNQSVDFVITSADLVTLEGYGSYGDANGKGYGNVSNLSLPTYSISFNDNGADAGAAMSAINGIVCGNSQAISAMTRTKTGHRFAGWKDQDENSYAAGATIANVTKDITLTAQWEVENYTLTWNLDGGRIVTAGTGAGPVAYGTALVAPTVEKDGYNFAAWSPAVAATMPAEAATYTATWTPASYGITYNLNGGSWNGEAGVATYTFGMGVATLATNVQKTGYRFAGWYDNEGLTGSKVTSITTAALGAKQLWAKWVEQVTVTFQNNGNTLAENGTKTMDINSALGEMPILTAVDACDQNSTTFMGWTKQAEIAADGSDLQLAEETDNVAVSTTYNAVWAQAIAGSNSGTKSWGASHITQTDVNNYSSTAANLTLNGNSWAVNGYGLKSGTNIRLGKGGANYMETPASSKNIASITVTWYQSTSYYLTVATTSGTELIAHQSTAGSEASPQTYTFTGWSGDYTQLRLVSRRATDDSSPNGNALATISAVTVNYGTPTTYSNYLVRCVALQEYDVTFNNGDRGTLRNADGQYSVVSLKQMDAVTGYTHVGWTANADVEINSETITAGTQINHTASAIVSAATTFTAVWTRNQHTLTWNKGGEGDDLTGDYTHGTVEYGAEITAPNDPTWTGHVFTGWGVAETAATMPDNDLTYTAQWEKEVYAIKWYVNGEELPSGAHSSSAEYGDAMSTLTVPTAPADNALACKNKFMGWSETELGSNEGQGDPGDLFKSVAGNATPITGEKNFYAVFANAEGSSTFTKVTAAPTSPANWNGDYIIVSGTNAMSNTFKGNGATSGEFETKSISETTADVIDCVDDDIIWTFLAGSTDGQYSIQNKATGTYAQITSTGNTAAALSNSRVYFTIDGPNSDKKFKLVSVSQNTKCFAFYSTNTTFRTYSTASNTTGFLYKRNGEAPNYSNYVTRCCTQLPAPTNLSALGVTYGVTMSWTPVEHATGYKIIWNGDTEHPIAVDGGNTNNYYKGDLGCGGGTTYTWSICATYSGLEDYCAEGAVANGPSVNTANCPCATYSFHYGTSGQGDWNTNNNVCFEATEINDGNGDVYHFSRNFTIPNKPNFNVAWAGEADDYTWNDEMTNLKFHMLRDYDNESNTIRLGSLASGNVGAIGTLVVYGGTNDDNKHVDFVPAGYVLRWGAGEDWHSVPFVAANAENVFETVWETEIMTVSEAMLNGNYYVGLKTATDYVWSPTMSQNKAMKQGANDGIGVKTGSGENWEDHGMTAAYADKQGKFRLWADNKAKNWNAHFVPYIQATFDANGGSCGSAVLPTERVSVEAEASARTITLPEATKTGHSLLWSDGANTYAAGTEVELTADMAFTAQWTAESYGITYHLNEGAWNGAEGVANYIYGTGVGALADNVERDGYRFEGWFDNDGLTGEAVTAIAADALGAKEFWAKWTRVYTVQFEENGNVDDDKTVLLAVGENTTLPSTTISECNEYDTFEGWVAATVDETTTKPGSVLAGGVSYTLESAGDVTLKALYSKCEGDGPEVYEKVTSNANVTTGKYLLVEPTGAYFFTSYGSSTGTVVQNTEHKNQTTYQLTEVPGSAKEVDVKVGTGDDAGKFSMYAGKAANDADIYLTKTSTENDLASSTSEVFTWEVMDGSTQVSSKDVPAGAIHSTSKTDFVMQKPNSGTAQFKCYKNTQTAYVYLYKKVGGCLTSYATNPDCSVPTEYVVTYKPNTENGGASHDDVVAEAVAWDEASTTKTVATCGFTARNAAGVFAKWNTQADGSGDDYAEGADIVNYNGTLYAIWENHYTVTLYDGDHENPSGSLRQEAADAEVTLPSGTLGCPGDGNYTFAGWTTDANMYDDQAVSLATIDAGGYVPTDDVSLYAVYSKSKITPDFALNCNGGNYNIGAQDETSMSDSWNNSETELYTYNYAYGTLSRNCSNVFTIKKVAANVYTIQNANGEYLRAESSTGLEFSTSTPDAAAKWTVSTGTNGDFRFTNNSYTGYALAKNDKNYKMTATSSIARTVYDLSLTPVNTLSYQSNPNCEAEHVITKAEATNGSFTVKDTEESPISIARNGATVVLAATPATGYQLGSWSVYKTEDEETTVTVTDNRFTMPDYDVTVAATFAPKNYNVTLNNNGATTAGAANVTATYGAMLPSIAGNLPVKTGYTFEGYYSGETQYIDNAGAGVLAWTTDGAGELTARWTEKTTSVTFYANNGSEPEENSGAISIAYASAADATFAPTKTSHRFTGYYTTREGDGVQIYDADKHMLKNVAGYTDATGWIYAEGGAALNLYARWEEVHFSVTYHVPSCQEAPATKDAVAEVGYTLPTMEAIYEYEFVGWHAGEAVSETTTRPTLLTGEYTPTGNVDLYAVYADGEYEDAMVGRLYANVNGTKKYMNGTLTGSPVNTMGNTTTAAEAKVFTITPTGNNHVTIAFEDNSTTKYLNLTRTGSSGNYNYNLQSSESEFEWTMSTKTAAESNGTLSFVATNYSNYSIMFRAETYNYFRTYSTSGKTGASKTDYYELNIEETDSRFPVMTSATYKSEPDCSTKYVVTYDADGGVGEICASQYYVADGFTVCAQTPTKEGYSFEGWNDGSTTYVAGAAYTLTQATTFTAQWGVVRVSSITIDQTEKAIEWKNGDAAPTFTLHVTAVAPANALDRTYTWRSSNTDVATVDAETGKVTIVAGGTANIYAEANDGSGVKSSNCVVTVTRKYKVTFTALEGLTIKVDESATKTQWKEAGDAVTLSVTVTNGYEWGAWDVTGATLNSEATVKGNGFTMPAGDVVVNATFTYKQDTYIDDMHGNVIDPETTKGKYTVPTLTEMPVSEGDCETTHLHFVGWIEGEIGTDTQDTEPGGLVKPGGTKAANGKTYHAVWAEQVD